MSPRNTLFFAIVVGLPASAMTADPLPLWPTEKEIIRQTNAQRAAYGLPPLVTDASLVRSARQHCWWMVNGGGLQHTTANVAENIAMGQGSVTEAVNDWMTSPGHRANMLSGSYRRIGSAAYRDASGTIYWCVQFLP